ncbi:MAG: acylphosphatase [Eubacterium sp.]|nr:acylphosphatase [Eubacterium sp.]
MEMVRRHMIFTGRVQGVGFRYRASYTARSLGVTGWVRNNSDGSVEMEAQGSEAQINKMLSMLNHDSYISIDRTDMIDIPFKEDEKGFHVKGY